MKRLYALILTIACLGCQAPSPPSVTLANSAAAAPLPPGARVRATIKDVRPTDGGASFRLAVVHAADAQGTEYYDQGVYSVANDSEQSRIYWKDGFWGTPADLKDGQDVIIWSGGAAESNPIQARAAFLVILGERPR